MANLTTVTEYKVFAEIGNNAQDARLALLVSLVSGLVETYCNRKFSLTPYVEVVENSDGFLFSRNLPLVTVDSVEYFSELKVWTTIDAEDYTFYAEESQIELFESFYTYPNTIKPYRITTTAGFSTVPADLKLAVLDLVTYYQKREQTPVKSSTTVTVNTVEVDGSNFPPHIKRILDLYRVI